jgi:catechol 2,3-dioxygenase-like lactoylglutathione lyase family enzyme
MNRDRGRQMEVKGIIWVGSATDDRTATTRFFSEVLGMPVVTDVKGFSRLAAANGDRLELFGPDSVEHDQLDTGPVAGLWVDDAGDARAELIEAGVDAVTPLEKGRDGHRWFYFKAPDGNYYEICENPGPRPPRASSR